MKKKETLRNQYIFCKVNQKKIENKASSICRLRTQEEPDAIIKILCVDYKMLEVGCREYCKIHNLKLNKESNQETVDSNIVAPGIQLEKENPKKVRTFYLDEKWER